MLEMVKARKKFIDKVPSSHEAKKTGVEVDIKLFEA